jgi:hypothetical protein
MTALAQKGARKSTAQPSLATQRPAAPTRPSAETARREMTAAALQLCEEQEFPDTTGNLSKRIRTF